MSTLDQQLKGSLASIDGKSIGIAAKLVAAMADIDAVTKEGKNEAQGYKYQRATDVANEVRKALVKHGIAFGFDLESEERWQTDRFTKDGTMIGHMNYVSLKFICEFEDMDTGQIRKRRAIGWGSDVGDKAVYKATTGAIKYAMRGNFLIPDESDPENEQNGSKTQEEVVEQAQKKAAAIRTEMAEEQGPFSFIGDVLHCVVKGVQAKDTAKGSYKMVTFNGRLPNGANFASCWDKKMWELIAPGKEMRFIVQMKDSFANIKGVVNDEQASNEPSVEAYSGAY